jgi:serine/threonine protein kinase
MTIATEWICIKCGNEVDKDSERCPVCGATKDPLQGKILAGKYRLVKKLAEGGMGYVYQAEHTRLKHQNRRAIKILKEDVVHTPLLRKRFLREVELTHKLSQSNPHIVSIYDDYGFEDGIGYYVMEYLEGLLLESYIKQYPGSLSLSWIVNIAIQICDALHTVHEEQIIHRDLKPANIFVIKDAQDKDFVKLIDFGVAKADNINTQFTAQCTILGTLLYIAPEQINTKMLKNLDGRCDIYALGCIMYEMLTGQLFLPSPENMDTSGVIQYMAARLNTQPPPPSSKRRDIPPLLDFITLKMLAHIPEQRYQTASEVSADLQMVEEQIAESASLQLAALGEQVKAPINAPFAALSKISIILVFLVVGAMLGFWYGFYKPKQPDIWLPPLPTQPQVADVNQPFGQSIPQRSLHDHAPNDRKFAALDSSLTPHTVDLRPKISKLKSVKTKRESQLDKMPAPPHTQQHAPRYTAKRKYHKQSYKQQKLPQSANRKQYIKKKFRLSVAGCPPNRTGFRWVHLKVSPARIGSYLRFFRGKGYVRRVPTGFCISQKSSTQIQITATGYQPCILTLPANAATLSIKMKKEVIDDIFDGSKDYCLQTR